MISKPRWIAECFLMDRFFPQFKAFARNGTIGFQGKLEGPRTKRIYDVTLQASVRTYPELEPAVYMSPHPEPHHWIGTEQRLCVKWNWYPSGNTFEDMLLIVAKYIAEFD